MLNYNLDVIFFLVPNCPFYYVGAKLSWCQIVRCQIVRFYYVGAKLSWCQIVRCQIVLVPNCPGAKLSGAKLSYHLLDCIKIFKIQNFQVNVTLMKMAGLSICCFLDNGGKPPSIDLFWSRPCQPRPSTLS